MNYFMMVGLLGLWIQPALFAQLKTPPPAAAPSSQWVTPSQTPTPIPPGSGKWWKNSATVRALGLSDAQVEQLEAVYMQHQARLAQLRSDLLRQEERLRALLEADTLDEGAVAVQINMVGTARLSLEMENDDMTLGMRRVMTADQWRKLEKLRGGQGTAPLPLPARVKSGTGQPGEEVYDVKSTPGITEPSPMIMPMPPYTPEARAARVEGILVLQAIIATDGSVSAVRVIRGLGYGLDESAENTVKTKWRFRPGMLNGQPVNVRAMVEITFRLY